MMVCERVRNENEGRAGRRSQPKLVVSGVGIHAIAPSRTCTQRRRRGRERLTLYSHATALLAVPPIKTRAATMRRKLGTVELGA